MIMDANLLNEKTFTCTVSSVLNKNASIFGKKYMFDNDESTCWNSDQGKPQWIKLKFEEKVQLKSFKIQFQGGFVGSDCVIEFGSDSLEQSEPFYPENNNSLQTFNLMKQQECTHIKFLFKESSDTYGRIIIYKLAIFST